jgi:hypothetical protein
VSPGEQAAGVDAGESSSRSALQALFHRLNNQLGIVLAHAELLEAKAADRADRVRAEHVVMSALAAMGTVREIREKTGP